MRIKIQLPQEEFRNVRTLANKIGIPIATLISMMVVDTLMNENIQPTKSKYKKSDEVCKSVNVSFDENFYYDVILKVIQQTPRYTIKELVIDCIHIQLIEFSLIYNIKNPEFAKRQRIEYAENYEKKHAYSKEVKKQYKNIVPVEDYIEKKSITWGIQKKSIKQYYCAKQINIILKKYENEQDIFYMPYDE